MSVGLIRNLLNEVNKCILYESMVRTILFYSLSSINLVLNLNGFYILFITYPQNDS